jgi:hypothetical protein
MTKIYKKIIYISALSIIITSSKIYTAKASNEVNILNELSLVSSKKIIHTKEKKWRKKCFNTYLKELRKTKEKGWFKKFRKTKSAYCTEYDYTLYATAQNASPDIAKWVTAAASSANPKVLITDGDVSFGDIQPSSNAISTDTLSLRTNGLTIINTVALQWRTNYNIVTAEDSSSGLQGPDTNSNGIRDDIDRLIAAKFSQTPDIKKAAEQDARAIQSLMEAATQEEVYAAVEKVTRATKCIYQALPEHTLEQEKLRDTMIKTLEAWTANTRERLVKYMDSNKLAGGGYYPEQSGSACD